MLPMLICAIENVEDRDMMTDFYLRYRAYLFHLAQKYLNKSENAEDIVHDALACILNMMDVFRELQPGQQLVYAKVTIKNLAYSYLRRCNQTDTVSFDAMELELPMYEDSSPETVVMKKQMQEKIVDIWRQLDTEDRLLLEQKYILQWTDEKLAARLGIQPQSVRMRLTRAKRKIARQMSEKGFEAVQW